MKSRRPAYTLPRPPHHHNSHLPPLIKLLNGDPSPATNDVRLVLPSEVGQKIGAGPHGGGTYPAPRLHAPKRHQPARLEEGGEAGLKQLVYKRISGLLKGRIHLA